MYEVHKVGKLGRIVALRHRALACLVFCLCCQACELRWAVVVGNCLDLAAKVGLVSACNLLLLDGEHCINGKVEETEVCVRHLNDDGPHLFFPCI